MPDALSGLGEKLPAALLQLRLFGRDVLQLGGGLRNAGACAGDHSISGVKLLSQICQELIGSDNHLLQREGML